MTQKDALERLAKWGMGATWAYEWYLDLLARNVAWMQDDPCDVWPDEIIKNATTLTHATIQGLEVTDGD